MKFPRITTRRLMIAVAVIAVAFAAVLLLHRRSMYLVRAQQSRTNEEWYESFAQQSAPDAASDARETKAFYARLRAKYEQAASHPWITIEPDTPPPLDFAQIEREMEPGWNETQRAIYRAIRRNGWRGDIRKSDVARILGLNPEVIAREMEPMFGTILWEKAKPDAIIRVK
jgi:hypothetical protein